MRISVKTKGNFQKTIKKLADKLEMTDFLFDLSIILNGKIKTRVQKNGQGVKGSLEAYTNKYKRFRNKRGRQSNFRDLTLSGSMFQSLTQEKLNKNEVRMFFAGKDNNKKAYFNDKRTPFFELTTNERQFIRTELTKFSKL